MRYRVACAVAKKGRRWRIYAECCASLHYGFAQCMAVWAVRVRSRTSRASAFSLDGLSSLRAPRTPRMRRRKLMKGMRFRGEFRFRPCPGGPGELCFSKGFRLPLVNRTKIVLFECLRCLFAIATSPMPGRVPDAERATSEIAERYAFSL